MNKEVKVQLVKTLDEKYQRRMLTNNCDGAVEFFEYLQSLRDEELKTLIVLTKYTDLVEKVPTHKLSLLLAEEFERLWANPQNREELRRTHGTVPKIKKAIKSFANKLRNNGEKDENG